MISSSLVIWTLSMSTIKFCFKKPPKESNAYLNCSSKSFTSLFCLTDCLISSTFSSTYLLLVSLNKAFLRLGKTSQYSFNAFISSLGIPHT